eukprot:gene6771-9474_t
MFWEELELHASSNLDEVLEKESFTLEELLDHDALLQEYRTNNLQLVEFLSKDENVDKMLHYITKEPSHDQDEKTKFKYPDVSAEVLSADVAPTVLDTLIKEEHQQKLWNFLGTEESLHPLLTSFVIKVLQGLFTSKMEEMTTYLKNYPNLLNAVWKHIEIPAIATFILNLTAVDLELQAWFTETFDLVGKCLGILNPESAQPLSKLQSIEYLFQEVIYYARRRQAEECHSEPGKTHFISPLLARILREDSLTQLLQYTFSSSVKSQETGLRLLYSIITHFPRFEDEPELTESDNQRLETELESVYPVLIPYLKKLDEIIQHNESTDMVGTASGFFPRFGTTRLFALKILATLFRKENDNVMRELLALNTLLTCFTMFKTYPNNNFLHNEIYSILDFSLMCAPENEKSELQPRLVFAVQGGQITDILLDLWDNNVKAEKLNQGHRLGYMGFLTQIIRHISRLEDCNHAELNKMLFPTEDIHQKWKAVRELSQQIAALFDRILGGEKPTSCYADSEDDFYVPPALMKMMAQMNNDDDDIGSSDLGDEYFTKQLTPELPMTLLENSQESALSRAVNPQVDVYFGQGGVFDAGVTMVTDLDVEANEHPWKIKEQAGLTIITEEDLTSLAASTAIFKQPTSHGGVEDTVSNSITANATKPQVNISPLEAVVGVSGESTHRRGVIEPANSSFTESTDLSGRYPQADNLSPNARNDDDYPQSSSEGESLHDSSSDGDGDGDGENVDKSDAWPTQMISTTDANLEHSSSSADAEDEHIFPESSDSDGAEESYDLAKAYTPPPPRQPVDVPLSPRGARAVQHITAGDRVSSSPISSSPITSEIDSFEMDTEEENKIAMLTINDGSTVEQNTLKEVRIEETHEDTSVSSPGNIDGNVEGTNTPRRKSKRSLPSTPTKLEFSNDNDTPAGTNA